MNKAFFAHKKSAHNFERSRQLFYFNLLIPVLILKYRWFTQYATFWRRQNKTSGSINSAKIMCIHFNWTMWWQKVVQPWRCDQIDVKDLICTFGRRLFDKFNCIVISNDKWLLRIESLHGNVHVFDSFDDGKCTVGKVRSRAMIHAVGEFFLFVRNWFAILTFSLIFVIIVRTLRVWSSLQFFYFAATIIALNRWER